MYNIRFAILSNLRAPQIIMHFRVMFSEVYITVKILSLVRFIQVKNPVTISYSIRFAILDLQYYLICVPYKLYCISGSRLKMVHP